MQSCILRACPSSAMLSWAKYVRCLSSVASEPALQVSEMFASIQGEGPHSGRPSVFLRLGFCNLSCSWCDTPYTWLYTKERLQKVRLNMSTAKTSFGRTDGLLGEGDGHKIHDKRLELTRHSLSEVHSQIRSLADPSIRALVITGGEPLLHAKPLLELVPKLISDGFEIEFETNGTISPAGFPSRVHFNVSPKLSNSHQPESIRLNHNALAEFMSWPSAILKFVVDKETDLNEIKQLVSSFKIPHNKVFLMPQGRYPEELKNKGVWVADICRDHGFNYSHRIHIELWGSRRGI